jgi:N-acetyl sugar amidotransferase
MSETLPAYYGLPPEVRYCTRCTVSNQRPNTVIEFKSRPSDRKPTIQFDANGVCSACTFAEIKDTKIDWQAREEELRKVCAQFRSRTGAYDCIVPGSGGKDSSFTAHILKYKFGMNPLTVTWAPHKYTEVGFRNLQHWIHAGFDNYLCTPNGKAHRQLTKIAFENLVHPFQPFIIGQKLIAPRFAAMLGIPLIFYGENQAEYGNNISENDRATMDPCFFIDDPDPTKLFLSGVSVEDLMKKHHIGLNELNPYLPVEGDKLRALGAQVHYLGYYLKWDPQECYYYSVEHLGFESNTERTEGSYSKYSSIDDCIDPLHFYTTFIKFGIGRATYDTAQEIRNKKITREEGVALVRRYDSEFPAKYFKEILEYMDISEQHFHEVIDKARSPHLWEKVDGQWKLRHQVS